MMTPRTTGRQVAVRLTDVPLKVRKRAATPLIDRALRDGDLFQAVELTRAVEAPSGVLYWISREAACRVIGCE